MKYFFLLLLTFFSNAQTIIFSDNFSNLINNRLTAKTSHFWVQDSQWVADNSTTIFVDQEGSTTLTEGAANWPAWSLSDPVYSGGNTLNFAGSGQALTASTAPTDNLYAFMAVVRPTSIVNAGATAQQLLHLEGGFYGVEFGASSAGVTNEIVLLTTDGTSSRNYWASATDSISAQVWHVLIMQWDGAKYQVWLDGAEKTTSTTGTPAVLAMDTNFRIGLKADNTRPLLGNLALVKLYDVQLTDTDVKNETFLGRKWVSLNGGVTRTSFSTYDMGVVSDTVYFDSLLTAGTWSISIQDSAGSGVAYEILTSTDKSTWSTLATGTTGTTWGTKTYSGTGSGYIGISVASGTAFFDNLTVTLQPATASGKFKGNSTYDKFKGF